MKVTVEFDSSVDNAQDYLTLFRFLATLGTSNQWVEPVRGIANGTQILPAAVTYAPDAVDLPEPISWVQMETAVFTPESEEDKTSSLEEAIQRYMVNGVRKVFL